MNRLWFFFLAQREIVLEGVSDLDRRHVRIDVFFSFILCSKLAWAGHMRPADFRSSTIIITDPKLLGIPNGRYIEQLNIFQVAFVKFMTVVVFVYLN